MLTLCNWRRSNVRGDDEFREFDPQRRVLGRGWRGKIGPDVRANGLFWSFDNSESPVRFAAIYSMSKELAFLFDGRIFSVNDALAFHWRRLPLFLGARAQFWITVAGGTEAEYSYTDPFFEHPVLNTLDLITRDEIDAESEDFLYFLRNNANRSTWRRDAKENWSHACRT